MSDGVKKPDAPTAGGAAGAAGALSPEEEAELQRMLGGAAEPGADGHAGGAAGHAEGADKPFNIYEYYKDLADQDDGQYQFSAESDYISFGISKGELIEALGKRNKEKLQLFIVIMRAIRAMSGNVSVNALKKSIMLFRQLSDAGMGERLDAASQYSGSKGPDSRIGVTDEDFKKLDIINAKKVMAKMESGATAASGDDPEALSKKLQEEINKKINSTNPLSMAS